MLWPVHCLSHSVGAAFHPKMTRSASDIIVQKGMDKTVDSYSGFGSPPEDTGLDKILKEKGVKTVYCVGLAMDYCVGSTALDAARLGYETFVIEDAVRGVFPEGSQKMCAQLKEAGIRLVESSSVLSVTERKGCCRS
uniref:nicotinamidase n=1 Tax=Chromera velia CCMP2878 TaxID=1169474 RepID=A0A0G4F7G3_9ALVE|eukprot:Cvel_15628.t1-p1 / transcript=Cvel_15628.t1 / gene=Cvel_15628 / organism=Chromera_velia_CCMP2878 / gene_product=Pyrazinamidase/nicotinamidase, putative / transcript_product=Pyrazinamidase/nicotinamidase, putative / location=Cvel_scaffold1164:25778-26185(-) / protein_length=136 / sequence_SO=supercontig / SO=protein_coding / is_pseudo=false